MCLFHFWSGEQSLPTVQWSPAAPMCLWTFSQHVWHRPTWWDTASSVSSKWSQLLLHQGAFLCHAQPRAMWELLWESNESPLSLTDIPTPAAAPLQWLPTEHPVHCALIKRRHNIFSSHAKITFRLQYIWEEQLWGAWWLMFWSSSILNQSCKGQTWKLQEPQATEDCV